MQIAFIRNQQLPYVSPYAPDDDAKLRFIAYGVTLVAGSFVVAKVEQQVLGNPIALLALVAALVAAARGCRALARLFPMRVITVDLDEAAPLPTQRLNLA